MSKQIYHLITMSCVLLGCSGCQDRNHSKPSNTTGAAATATPVTDARAATTVHHSPTKATTVIPTPTNLTIDTISAPADANVPSVRPGQIAEVHYTGWLWDNGQKGRKFDSSRDRGTPFSFKVGAGMVISGWDQGLQNMQVGGKYLLTIPAHLGYGARGAGAVIPPNAPLIFEIEVLGVKG